MKIMNQTKMIYSYCFSSSADLSVGRGPSKMQTSN